MNKWLRNNAIALGMAVLVGLLSVAPSFLAIIGLGQKYQGIPFFYADDEYGYTARMHEITDGHWLVGSVDLFEYKRLLPVMPPLGEYLYALPAMALRIPVSDMVYVYRFLFPAILFWLAYRLFMSLTDDEGGNQGCRTLTGVASGLIVAFLYDQVCLTVLLNFKRIFFATMWTRTVNPIIGALAVFVFLIYLWKSLKEDRARHKIIAGLILSVSFFYFFSWGMILSCVAVAVVLALSQKRLADVKKLLLIILIGLMGSVPWVVLALSALRQGGQGSMERFGMSFTHWPTPNIFVYTTLAVFGAVSWYFWRIKKRQLPNEAWWIFSLTIGLACLWVYCQQLITGHALWPYHFVQYTKPLMLVVMVLTGYKLLRPIFPRLWLGAMSLICVLSLSCGVAMAVSFKNLASQYEVAQKNAPVMDWLNRNAPKDCVVLFKPQDELMTSQITALTHCNVYVSFWTLSGIPFERTLHNFYVYLRLKGIRPDELRAYLLANRGEIRRVYFENWDQMRIDRIDAWFMDRLDSATKGYAQFYSRDFAEELRKYKLDYLVTPNELTPEEMDNLKIESTPMEVGDKYIYRVE